MKISVLIVTYDSDDDLRACVKSLMAGKCCPEEIIVVNNNTERKCDITATYPDVTLINSAKNEGFSAGLNLAAASATGDVYLISNPDVEYDADALGNMEKSYLNTEKIGVLGPRVVGSDGVRQNSARSFPSPANYFFNRESFLTRIFPGNKYSDKYLNPVKYVKETTRVDWVSGCSLLTSAKTFREVGGFDSGYFLFMEDVDYCWRVSKLGLRIQYEPSATVIHKIGISNQKTSDVIIKHRHQSIRRFIRTFFAGKSWLFKNLSCFMVWLREKLLIVRNCFR